MIHELRPKYPGIPLVRMCQLLCVSRSLFYRKPCDRPERAEFLSRLRREIVSVLAHYPYYGYRRVRLELEKQGSSCGYKSVSKVLCQIGPRKKRLHKPVTSDGKGRPYPNLLRGMKVTAPGSAWVADLTCIPLPKGFGYLAVVRGVYTRRVVGFSLGPGMEAELPLSALRQALGSHPPAAGFVHHSDRGSQYLSREYVGLVESAGGRISCSAKGNPYDNAFMESFYKTLKTEEVYLEQYENLDHARRSVTRYISQYNGSRLHSSLGYQSPDEFAATWSPPKP